jgi:hypothetical protein
MRNKGKLKTTIIPKEREIIETAAGQSARGLQAA